MADGFSMVSTHNENKIMPDSISFRSTSISSEMVSPKKGMYRPAISEGFQGDKLLLPLASLRTRFPSFIRSINERHVSPSRSREWMQLPPELTKEFLGQAGSILALSFEESKRSWAVEWRIRMPRGRMRCGADLKFGLSIGWKQFQTDAALKTGDVLLFVLESKGQFRVSRVQTLGDKCYVGGNEKYVFLSAERQPPDGGVSTRGFDFESKRSDPVRYPVKVKTESICGDESASESPATLKRATKRVIRVKTAKCKNKEASEVSSRQRRRVGYVRQSQTVSNESINVEKGVKQPSSTESLIGQKVVKTMAKGRKQVTGKVVASYRYFLVRYDDNDSEELYWEDLKDILADPEANTNPDPLLVIGKAVRKQFFSGGSQQWFSGVVESRTEEEFYTVQWSDGKFTEHVDADDIRKMSLVTENSTGRQAKRVGLVGTDAASRPPLGVKSDVQSEFVASKQRYAEVTLFGLERTLETFDALCRRLGPGGQRYQTGHYITQRRPITTGELERTKRRAEAFVLSETRRFGLTSTDFEAGRWQIREMSPSHCYCGFWFGSKLAPMTTKFMPNVDCDVTLKDEEGEEWVGVWKGGRRSPGISGGWRAFALDHGLEAGDCVVLKYEGTPKRVNPVLSVTIFRVVEPVNGKEGWPVTCPFMHKGNH